MGIIWSDEGPRQEVTAWQQLTGAMISARLPLPLAEADLDRIGPAIAGEAQAMLRRLGQDPTRLPAPVIVLRPDEEHLAALVIDLDGEEVRLGLATDCAADAPPRVDDVTWLARGAGERELRGAWGRHLSVRSGWRLALLDADHDPGQPVVRTLAPGLGVAVVGLDATARRALARAADAAARGAATATPSALRIIQRGLGLDDPALMALADAEDLVIAGLLSSAPEHGGYRGWVGPFLPDLDRGALLALAWAERGDLVALVPPAGEVDHKITPERILFTAAGEGISPAEAARYLAGHFAARVDVALDATAALREALGEGYVLELQALDALEIRRGARRTTLNIDTVLGKFNDDVAGEPFVKTAAGLRRLLADDHTPYGMIDPEQAWFTLHLRPPDVPSKELAVVDTTTDDLGNRFTLVACTEDPQAVLPLRDAADFGGVMEIRRRLRQDVPRLTLDAEAITLTGALGEVVALALVGSNIATALVRPPLVAQVHAAVDDVLPGAGALVAVAPACGMVLAFRIENAEAAFAEVDGMLQALGARAGAPLGFYRTLATGPTAGGGVVNLTINAA